jgi:3-hydroxybutyryl-CoA dehydrogenase
MNVLVVGVGLMGSQIACEYALGGHHVALLARHPEHAADRLRAALQVAADIAGAPDRAQLSSVASRLSIVRSLDDVVPETELIVESLVEDFSIKVEQLEQVSGTFPEATIASNTSSLSISRLGDAIDAATRVLGTHYWNPPLLMPLVEVTAGSRTDAKRVDKVVDVLTGLGKRPVRVARDVPGFVWNRLQFALLREALWIVENGVASPDTVDEIVRYGLARRWRLTGPFETVALGGADTFAAVANNLFPHLSSATAAGDLRAWTVSDDGALAAARERRDQELARELERDRAEQG